MTDAGLERDAYGKTTDDLRPIGTTWQEDYTFVDCSTNAGFRYRTTWKVGKHVRVSLPPYQGPDCPWEWAETIEPVERQDLGFDPLYLQRLVGDIENYEVVGK